jgi:hypothetical protein
MRAQLAMAGLAVLLYGAAGCTQGPTYYPVSGTVTVDGKQLERGDIFFVDISGRYGPDPGKIEDGRFQFKAKAGKKRVEISASKIFPGGAKGAGGEPVPEEFLSPEYNTQSKLTSEVKPEGPNEFEFKLHGRKK